MKKKDSSLPHPLETFYIWGNHMLSQIENKHSDLLGSTILGFQLSLYKMGITMAVPLLALENQRDLNEIMEVKTSFQNYQSIFCLRLLKLLKSTIVFSSHKNCPTEISSLSALGGNLAFIFTFPYDHRVLFVQRDHKGQLSADLPAEESGAEGKAPEYLVFLFPSFGVQGVVHKCCPQHPGLLGVVILFAKLTFISFYFLLQTHEKNFAYGSNSFNTHVMWAE